MSAIKALTEDEKYLVAILMEPSGSELAEFLFEDNFGDPSVYPYGRYRLWPMQWPYYHDDSKYQIDASGRGVGKSVSAVLRTCAFPFAHPGEEMLITAPELSHLKLVTDKVEESVLKYYLLRLLLPNEGRNQRANGITNSPHFQIMFTNGTKVLSRLPNRDGKGVKGPHPLVIEQDEIQDYPERGFTELTETIRISEEGAMWRIHGVSNGVGDLHYRLTETTDPDMPFKVHKYIASHRPTWNDEERKAKIKLYGGAEDHPDYVRNIFGRPGSAHSRIFVLRRLMACVRNRESAEAIQYNEDVYRHIKLNDEYRGKMERENGLTIEDLIDIPMAQLNEKYSSYWGGMDIGYTTDPSEILIFGTYISDENKAVDRLLLRLTLERFDSPHQRAVIAHVFDLFGPRLRRFGMDKTGNGLPIYQEMLGDPELADRIAGYNFASKVTVDFEDRELEPGESEKDLEIKKHVVDFATDELRNSVDAGTLELPYDQTLLKDWQMQNEAKKSNEAKARKYWGGPDHSLDAARMYIAAKSLQSVEELLRAPKQEPVIARFG